MANVNEKTKKKYTTFKNNIKRVLAQNSMIPAQFPRELQDLTQTNFSR